MLHPHASRAERLQSKPSSWVLNFLQVLLALWVLLVIVYILFASGRRSSPCLFRDFPGEKPSRWSELPTGSRRFVVGAGGVQEDLDIKPNAPWDCHICRSVGVVWGVNVGIYAIHGVYGIYTYYRSSNRAFVPTLASRCASAKLSHNSWKI